VLVAAHLTALLRVLFDDVFDRTIAGQPKEAIVEAVWPVAEQAFDQLEPAFGGY
jgi:hypothetical protein